MAGCQRMMLLALLSLVVQCSADSHDHVADSACSSNSKCNGLEGTCCPTAEGLYLGCCEVSTTRHNNGLHSPACSDNDHCHGLEGDCCPTGKGTSLGCCFWTQPRDESDLQCHAATGCASEVGACCPARDGSIPACCQAAVSCKLLSGGFAMGMQAILLIVSVAVLVSKYYLLEVAKGPAHSRTWDEFALDSGKQICGAGWIHVANLLCAMFFNQQHDLDQCTAYWLNIMIDTTLGVLIEYAVLTLLVSAIDHEDFKSGEYMNNHREVQWDKFFKQLAMWLSVVAFMKVVVTFVINFVTPLSMVAMKLLSPLNSSPDMKLMVVMIFTPVCMNAFQFFVCDVFLKKDTRNVAVHDDGPAPYIPVRDRPEEPDKGYYKTPLVVIPKGVRTTDGLRVE